MKQHKTNSKSMLLIVLSVIWVALLWIGTNAALQLTRSLVQWWEARTYISVPAKIEMLTFRRYAEENKSHSLEILYTFHYLGNNYRSHQLGLFPSKDYPETWRQQQHALLSEAKEKGRTIYVWINANHPSDVIYDKDLNRRAFLMQLPRAIGLPLFSLFLFFVLKRQWFPSSSTSAQSLFNKTTEDRWRNSLAIPPYGLLLREPPHAVLVFLIFVVFWNFITWTMTVNMWNSYSELSLTALLTGLFPLVGILLFSGFMYLTIRRYQLGKVFLYIDKAPHIGSDNLNCKIYFVTPLGSRLHNKQLNYTLQCELLCQRIDSRPRNQITHTECQQTVVETTLHHGAHHYAFSLSIPCHLPASQMMHDSAQEIQWHLRLKALGGEIQFSLPIASN